MLDEEKGQIPSGFELISSHNHNTPHGSPHNALGVDTPGRPRVNSLENSLKSIPPNMKIDINTLSGPIRRYYQEQQELIGLLSHNPASGADEEDDENEKYKGSKTSVLIAIRASYASNIILLIVKIYALIISGSLAMLASVLDSCLDILSGSVLFCAQRIVDQQNKYKYPIGKNRAQPIATIIFACLMGMSALQVS